MYSSPQQKCQNTLEDPFFLLHINKKEKKNRWINSMICIAAEAHESLIKPIAVEYQH